MCLRDFSQAVAAGLGGVALAAILAALCLNYKHFGGGLPDLLLMRAVRTRSGGGGDGGNTTGARSPGGTAEPVLEQAEVSTVRGTIAASVCLREVGLERVVGVAGANTAVYQA